MKIVETKQQGIKSAYTLTQGDRVLTLHVLTDLAIYREDQNTETLFRKDREGFVKFKSRCVANAISLLEQKHSLIEVHTYA
jgi:hypothetical protein